MKKTLLIEAGFLINIEKSPLLESIILESKASNGRLVIKGVPATILDKKNSNGRIYTKNEMLKALRECKGMMDNRQLLCTANEHPESSFPIPIESSHLLVNSYIKEINGQNILFDDWELLDTDNGRNLKALIEAGVGFGTSIRGLGDIDGDEVTNYERLGTDVVGCPSSGTYLCTSKELGTEVTLEYVKESSSTSTSANLCESKENKMKKEILESVKKEIMDLVESKAKSSKINSLIVEKETQLVNDYDISHKEFNEWDAFKSKIYKEMEDEEAEDLDSEEDSEEEEEEEVAVEGKGKKMKKESFELKDKIIVAERKLAAADLISKNFREKIIESNKRNEQLKSEVVAGEKLIEAALAKVKETKAYYKGEFTEKLKESIKNGVKEEFINKMEALMEETIETSVQMIKEAKANSIKLYKGAKLENSKLLENNKKLMEQYEIMKNIAVAVTEELKSK